MVGKIARAVGIVLIAGMTLQTGPRAWPARAALAQEAAAAGMSLRITGSVANPASYRARGLAGAARDEADRLLQHRPRARSRPPFTGVLLWTLLEGARIRTDPAVRNDFLRRTVRLVATDG